jgi:hypothetical protein
MPKWPQITKLGQWAQNDNMGSDLGARTLILYYIYIYILYALRDPADPPMTDWKEILEMRPNIAQVGLLREYSPNGLPAQVGDEKRQEMQARSDWEFV